MFASDGANCQVPSVGIEPWFYSQKLGFLHYNQKPNASAEKVGFFPSLVGCSQVQMTCLTSCI
jgi:hypothetical protein